MLEFAGQDLTNYFPPPMILACPGLVDNADLGLMRANFTPLVQYAVHTSGKLQTIPNTKLDADDWYTAQLTPALQQYYKGSFVYDKAYVASEAEGSSRQWAIYNKKVYDLSDYLYTVQYFSGSSGTDLPNYDFLNSDLTKLFQTNAGQDITKAMNNVLAKMPAENVTATMNCLNTAFYYGEMDFRKTPRCTVQNYLLLAFSVIIMTTMGAKCESIQRGKERGADSQSWRRCNWAQRDSRNCSTNLSFAKYRVTPKAKSLSRGPSTRSPY
jgi:chitin synthase